MTIFIMVKVLGGCPKNQKIYILYHVLCVWSKMMAKNNYAMITKSFHDKTMEMKKITSDDFRKLKLDKKLKGESRNKIGGFFRYLHLAGFIVKAGMPVASKIPSCRMRKIGVWKWSKKAIMMLQ